MCIEFLEKQLLTHYIGELDAPGFMHHRYSAHLTIQLPAPLANELELAREREAQRLEEELERERQVVQAKRKGSAIPTSHQRSELEKAASKLVAQQEQGLFNDATAWRQIYALDELAELRARADKTVDGERAKCLNRYADDFIKRGLHRPIAWPAKMQALDDVVTRCPTFAEVVDIIRAELRAARRAERAPQVPPLLLLGDPGVGKTHFCRLLAQALGAQHHTLCFDSPIAGSALTGVDPQWGTGKPGLLIDAICASSCANPIIVLDEIDKALRGRNDAPLGPLHSLLERPSAMQFRDIFADFRFDASLVTWVATANDPQRIPSTIRSRFTEITIGAPTGAQAIELATAIMTDVIRAEAPPDFDQISHALCVELAHLTPRELKRALSAAIRRAVDNGRMHAQRQDFPRGVFGEDADQEETETWLH